ncbi:MAG TPA: SAF domain-containing protein [Pseudonocardia sp.]
MPDARLAPRLHHRLAALVSGPGWRRTLILRRTASALLVLLALITAVAPAPGSTRTPVVVAAVDLAAGRTIQAADLALRRWPAELVPAGSVRDPTAARGRVLVGAARAGEPITDVRLVGAGLLPGGQAAAVPVRLADAAVAALLVPGRKVDVVTAGERSDQPVLLADDAEVLAVLPEDPHTRGRLVIVGMPRQIATRVAAASLADQVAITLRD